MDRSAASDASQFHHYHPEAQVHFCSSWVARNDSLRQPLSFERSEFKEFIGRNAIRHVTLAPYHPSSNGLGKRAVQTLKASMKKITAGSVETKVARLLFQYQLTPHASTGQPPAELLLGCFPRSLLDNLKPYISAHVRRQQQHQKHRHDARANDRQFDVGDQVFVRQFSQRNSPVTWYPGTVEAVRGPVSY